METQELDAPRVEMQPIETRELEHCRVHEREVAKFGIAAGKTGEATPPEKEAAQTEEAELGTRETQEAQADAAEACEQTASAWDERGGFTQMSVSEFEEDETQLAAIRELMARAGARGIWLSLGEIAEATEFAEASISAQLRHLRKADHGGHRVEKRRRGAARTAAARRSVSEARRGSVVWEYRVLPRA